MPLVENSALPAFSRLQAEGVPVLTPERAQNQDIRELHIGLLNMMPDGALEATERQFFRLIAESNPIAQFYVHPFTLPELPRGSKAQAHIDQFYETFESIQQDGLDALIITGANVSQPDLTLEPFWGPLTQVLAWAENNVTSTLCSCLATHAVLQFRYGKKRRALDNKRWGVYEHHVMNQFHPLVNDINTRFDVPHSRFNQIDREMFEAAGLHVLVESEEAGVHLAVSSNYFRIVFFQGHPEYDTISLLKEYKREVINFFNGQSIEYPPFPEKYFGLQAQAILQDYQASLCRAKTAGADMPDFPEALIAPGIDNTWHDTGEAVVGNWIGLIYQVTHADRKLPFMAGIDPDDPLGLK